MVMNIQEWPVKKVKLTELLPWARNPRKITKEAYARLKERIIARGFHDVLKIDTDNTVLSGNQRLRALKELGVEEVFCKVAPKKLSEKEREIVALESNKNDGVDDWDELANFDLSVLQEVGFTEDEINLNLNLVGDDPQDAEPQIDKAAALNKIWKVKLGDLFAVGDHRLLCADCTVKENVALLMAGEKADMVFTDPPYGIKRDKGLGVQQGFRGKGKIIPHREYKGGWDNGTPTADTFNLMLGFSNKAIIFGGNFFTDKLPQSNHWIVWDKKTKMPTFGDAELIWTNIKRDSVSIIEFEYSGLIGKEKERFHPTQKPVGLLVKIIEDYSKNNEAILDPFGGSGSTLIACQNLKRKCRMMEIDPGYCAVILQRATDAFPEIKIKQINLKTKRRA